MSHLPDAEIINEQLQIAGVAGLQVHVFEQLGSTNAWLREHARGLEPAAPESHLAGRHPHLCVTDWQSAGVGRRGKDWQACAGNLMLSILSYSERPAQELVGLSLVTGIAVAECLQNVAGVCLQLKWPNDLILGGAKLGGLLTELSSVSASATGVAGTQLLTGIGINLLHDDAVTGLSIGATSLEAAGVACSRRDRDILAAHLAARVLIEHQQFDNAGWSAFAERWAALDWLMGKEVLIHGEKTTEQAVARGVNEQGALLVERDGKCAPVFSGNVSIRPKL